MTISEMTAYRNSENKQPSFPNPVSSHSSRHYDGGAIDDGILKLLIITN